LEGTYSERQLDKAKQIINIDSSQSFTKRMLVLQWFLFENSDMANVFNKMIDNVENQQNPNGLYKRLKIYETIGALANNYDEEVTKGSKSARTDLYKMAKEGIIFRSDGKNKKLTDLGHLCGHFIYFKVLEGLIGIKRLWEIIKTDLTKKELQDVDPNITIQDLESWFIIERESGGYVFTREFNDFIHFFEAHP
jgi:hypothetical protein